MSRPDVVTADVVIVGAGIVGASLAFRLVERGLRVVIIDRGRPGSATTSAGLAGITAEWGDSTVAQPMWDRLIPEFRDLERDSDGDWLHLDGTVEWGPDSSAPSQDHHEKVAHMRRQGLRAEVLPARAVTAEIEPELRIDATDVLVAHDQGWVEAGRCAAGLVAAATQGHGALLLTDDVVHVNRTGTDVIGVSLRGGTRVKAGLMINAAGPWATSLAMLAGTSLPVTTQAGAVVVTERVKTRLRVSAYAPGLNVRPEPDGRIMIQRIRFDTTLSASTPPGHDHPSVIGAVQEAALYVPSLERAHVGEVRFGARPIPADGRPIIGPDPRVGRLYHVVMHSGVRRSAVVARYVTKAVTGEHVPELSPYGVERFTSAA